MNIPDILLAQACTMNQPPGGVREVDFLTRGQGSLSEFPDTEPYQCGPARYGDGRGKTPPVFTEQE